MTVIPNLAHDLWGYEEVVKRATSILFNPPSDSADNGAPSLTAAKRERFEKKRVALLYFVEGLLHDQYGALKYACELAEDALPPKPAPAPKPGKYDFDVVGEQPHRHDGDSNE